MTQSSSKKPSRRSFLKGAALAAGAAGVGAAGVYLGSVSRVSRAAGKKIIIIGIDGMDPRLSESMMREGLLPRLAKLRAAGGFSDLGTSIPPQSPVAWANFINGAGPGSHGIFDFLHRDPHQQCAISYSAASTTEPEGGLEIGDHKLQLDFWPFNHKPPKAVLLRQGVPFWNYLDGAGIPSTFYDLPSNYPPSPSTHGHHRCISGMGTPDVSGIGLGGTCQLFVEGGEDREDFGSVRSGLSFDSLNTAQSKIRGPRNSLLIHPETATVPLEICRDSSANAAIIKANGKRVVLRPGEWSRWTQLDFNLGGPWFTRSTVVSGICRFYLQSLSPLRLYVSPINIDPANPAMPISEPSSFIRGVANKIGPFYTTGFQEDFEARKRNIFNDDEFIKQATLVLEDRLRLYEYALQNYDDGLLFFYFSSSDLQSHMLWWEGDEKHPTRTPPEAARFHEHIRQLYQRLDRLVGDLHDRYGSQATIIVMSDHGFANFGKQFNLNKWLLDHGYINPTECAHIRSADWANTDAYGLGLNGLYLNLKGRERDGSVEPGMAKEKLDLLITQLEAEPAIRKVYRSSEVYHGGATELAPDLIIGYNRGYRASWGTAEGDLREANAEGEYVSEAYLDNLNAWSADHCMDALEVPGVLWSNHAIQGKPRLIDLAPSILAAYGLPIPEAMTGQNVLGD